jgi:cytochrome c553
MIGLLVGALVVLGLLVASAPVGRAQPDPFAEREPDINQGRFVAVGGFIEGRNGGRAMACMQCHGLDGAGDAAGAFPRLAGQSAWYLYKSLRDYASGARPNDIMTPIARALSDVEMQDVSAYYASIENAPYPPPPRVDAEALQRGGALNAVGSARLGVQGCVNCHGPGGRGLPPSFPYLAGLSANYLEHQMHLFADGTRRTDPMGVMELIARSLTPEDIRAVSLYFASLRPDGSDEFRPPGTAVQEQSPGVHLGITPHLGPAETGQ